MTQSTEQERAEFEAWAKSCGFELWRDPISNGYIDFGTADAYRAWQAARREQVVPQGWRLVPEESTDAMARAFRADDAPYYFAMTTIRCNDFAERWRAVIAAAPLPPQVAQLDDTNVVDMPQAVDLKGCAPVQMPEPAFYADDRGYEVSGEWLASDEATSDYRAVYIDPRYTEHQVRQILADHGVK